MKLLLTNDDGIDAPGLIALEDVARNFGEVVVVAPDRHLSGCSHQATTHAPLELMAKAPNRFAVSGTPADCVRLGLLHVAPDADWVLSGVNDGANLGVDVFLSGTVAAAREAALLGRRAIALSQYRLGKTAINWQTAPEIVARVMRELIARNLSRASFWNVNFPENATTQEKLDVVFCPLDPNPLHIQYSRNSDAFHFQGVYQHRKRNAKSDVDVCFGGGIAVSEVRLGFDP